MSTKRFQQIAGLLMFVMLTTSQAFAQGSSEKAIISFKILGDGTIDEGLKTVAVTVPYGTVVTNLVPMISVSPLATVDPLSGVAQDFTNPVEYTVTAEDSSTQIYTVTVSESIAVVNLGSTANFAILSGAAITSTGGGTINGDVGASPITGAAIGVTPAQVNGIIYAVDATGPVGSVMDPVLLTAAKGDLTIAYNDAAGRTPIPSGPYLNPGAGNIGGMDLASGLYKFTGAALITGSDVTLTGSKNAVWIFQIPGNLSVGTGIKVTLAGGAQAKNVFWQVGGTSAIIGTSAEFKGTIMATQGITMNTTSTIDGRLLAFTAGIIFDGTSINLPPEDSTDATVTSATYTISNVGGGSETITDVPFNTSKAAFLAALTKGDANQTWNDTAIADPVVSGNTLVVTAQDEMTQITYTVTVNFITHYADTNSDWSISQGEVENFISISNYSNNNNSVTGDAGSITPDRITMREVMRVIYLYNNNGSYIGGQVTVDGYDIVVEPPAEGAAQASAETTASTDDSDGRLLVSSTADSGVGSLRDAIAIAADGETITIDDSLDTITVLSEIIIDKSITIDGNSTAILSGCNQTRIFRFENGDREINVTLKNLGIVDAENNSDEFGGAVYNNRQTLNLDTVLFDGNANTTENGKGGAVYSSGTLTVNNCVFQNNTASEENDIYSDNGDVTVNE